MSRGKLKCELIINKLLFSKIDRSNLDKMKEILTAKPKKYFSWTFGPEQALCRDWLCHLPFSVMQFLNFTKKYLPKTVL